MSLLVNEVFWSLQGEGSHTGRPSVFIRLQGCDVLCRWCDTGHSLSRDPSRRLSDEDMAVFAKETEDARYTAADPAWLVQAILRRESPVRHAVITGGEPFLQNIDPLLALLMEKGFTTQVETSGTRAIVCPAETWITLSPKRAKMPLPSSWARADEIKVPVQTEEDLAFFAPLLARQDRSKILLQPVSCVQESTALCLRACLENNWRLSLQTHKLISIR